MRTQRQQVIVAAVLLLLVGALLRAPSLALPLGPDDAVLARAAERLSRSEVPALGGRGPLMPALVALPIAAGMSPVSALRLLGLLAGAAAPALLLLLARRHGLTALASGLAGLLLALQPLWIAHAGGAEAGTWGLGLSLALLAWRGGRFALPASLLSLLAEPALWPQAILVHAVVLERAAPGRWVRRGALLAAAACACAYVVSARGFHPGSPGAAILGLIVAAGGALLVGAWRGAAALIRSAHGRALLVATLLQAGVAAAGLAGVEVAWGWDGLGALAPVAAGLALCVSAGLELERRLGHRRLAVAGLSLLLVLALWAALGPTQHAVLGEQAPLAGRLHSLGAAARLAAREAGLEGWVALDLGDGTAAQARALAPLLDGRPVLITPASGGGAEPPAGWPAGGPITLALLTVRPEAGPVTTLGGWGIFAQEPAGRSGAYHVQRIRRP